MYICAKWCCLFMCTHRWPLRLQLFFSFPHFCGIFLFFFGGCGDCFFYCGLALLTLTFRLGLLWLAAYTAFIDTLRATSFGLFIVFIQFHSWKNFPTLPICGFKNCGLCGPLNSRFSFAAKPTLTYPEILATFIPLDHFLNPFIEPS